MTSLFSCHRNALPSTSLEHEQLATKLDQLVAAHYSAGAFNGTVLVAQEGSIVLNKAYGHLDVAQERALSTSSLFEVASLSKQFTALLMVMFKENSELDFDDKVTKYLPDFPYENISIRHLLTHTSGLSERSFFQWAGQNMNPAKIYHNTIVLEYLKQATPELAFEPGERWEYSNVGYFVLPLILQEISGKHYAELLRELILNPLEMNRSGIYAQSLKGSEMPDYAFGKMFNPQDSTFMPAFGMAWSDSIYGSVGILANTNDLFKWDRALQQNTLVSAEALEEVFTAYSLRDGTSSGYGLGWFVRDDFDLNGRNLGKRVDHYGLWPGYESSIVRYVDQDYTIIVLASQSPSAKDTLVEEISKMLFEGNG